MDFLLQNNNWGWLAMAVASAAMLLWHTFRAQGSAISPSAATLLINRQDAVVLDVREPAEFADGHISKAHPVPLGQLAKRLDELQRFKDLPVIVVCRSGNRSANACGILKKSGFAQVLNLSGGMSAWEQAGLPVTKK